MSFEEKTLYQGEFIRGMAEKHERVLAALEVGKQSALYKRVKTELNKLMH
jgi:hypothetical protein